MAHTDGGPAFPSKWDTDTCGYKRGDVGMSLRDYFAIRAPEPTADVISGEGERDRQANPHNDHYKPKRRSRLEIIAELRYAYADAMLAERVK